MDHDTPPARLGVNARLLTVVDTVENAQNTPKWISPGATWA